MRRIVTREAAAAGTRDPGPRDGPLGVHKKTTDVQEAPQNRAASRPGRARRPCRCRCRVRRPLEPWCPADRRHDCRVRARAAPTAREAEATEAAAPSLEGRGVAPERPPSSEAHSPGLCVLLRQRDRPRGGDHLRRWPEPGQRRDPLAPSPCATRPRPSSRSASTRPRRPELARHEAAAGEVGNHTLDHHDLAHLPAAVGPPGRSPRASAPSPTRLRLTAPCCFARPTMSPIRLANPARTPGRVAPGLLERRQPRLAERESGGDPAAESTASSGRAGSSCFTSRPTTRSRRLRWLLTDLKRRHLRPVTVSRLLVDAPPTTGQLQADRRGRTCVEFPYR